MKDQRHVYYPYRIASLYGEFWRRIASGWDTQKEGVFIAACVGVYQSSRRVDPDLAAMEDVRRCRETIEDILKKTNSVPKD